MLYGPRTIHTFDPVHVQHILSQGSQGEASCQRVGTELMDRTDFGLGSRPHIFRPLLGRGIFALEGDAWKCSRDLIRKQLSRINDGGYDLLEGPVDEMLQNMLDAGPLLDLQPLFYRLTLQITTDLLLHGSDSGISKDSTSFARAFDRAQDGLAKRFRIAPWHNLYRPRSFTLACSYVKV